MQRQWLVTSRATKAKLRYPCCQLLVMLDSVARLKLVLDFERFQNVTKVANLNCTSRETVRHWVKVHRETGDVVARPAGRTPSLTAVAKQQAHAMLLSNKYVGTRHVAEELYAQGHTSRVVDRTTIARAAKSYATTTKGTPIHVVRGEPERELTSATKAKRVEFAKANRGTSWATVMFTDRKKFYFRYPGEQKKACYWVEKGSRPRVNKVNNPMAVNVYAGITKFGITKLHFVAGTSKQKSQHSNLKGQPARNITKSEYKEVLEKTLLPEGNKKFRNKGCTKWIFQQDNDPTHRVAMATIQAWNKAHSGCQVSLLHAWPGNSPDLNPIENLWAWAQAKVDAAGCKSFEEFKNCVKNTLKNVPPKMLHALVGSMKARLRVCIENGGDKTGY
jgi:DDE superfamily endonuclease